MTTKKKKFKLYKNLKKYNVKVLKLEKKIKMLEEIKKFLENRKKENLFNEFIDFIEKNSVKYKINGFHLNNNKLTIFYEKNKEIIFDIGGIVEEV